MQIVIDISEEEYQTYINHTEAILDSSIPLVHQDLLRAVINGTPLSSSEKPNKTGHWRHYENILYCSECGAEYYDEIMYYCGDDVPKYCPSCGCKMTASPTGEDSTCDACETPCVMYEKGMRGCNPTGADVLDKIRAELHATAEIHEDGDYYLREEWIDEIFDKYKASPTGAERS